MKYNKLYENWNKHLEEEATEDDPASAIERFLGFRLEPGQTLSGELKRAFKDWNAERLRKKAAEEEKLDVSPWDSIGENTEAEFVAEEFEERRQAGTLEGDMETISEDSDSDAEMVNLLSQISQKLDGLEDIDTSIDYLIGAVSGETALSAKMKQSTLGRFADASPQLAELIKKYQE